MLTRLLDLPRNHSFFLFGPRQTGKSTLLKSVFSPETTKFIDLLQADEFFRLSAEPVLFREEIMALPDRYTHVALDEVQRIPELLDEIHSIIEGPKPRIFCLSGSSARKLKRAHANLLAGRAWTFNLHPLTHIELAGQFQLDKALQFGTLPPAYLSENCQDAERTMRTYAQTYLEQEIQQEARVRNISLFRKFLTLAADANGSAINYSSIAGQFGESNIKVREYFSILEDTLIGYFLPPFASSQRKRLTKHPKFYFFDTGVVRALMGKITVPVQRSTDEFGRCFEHFIINECMRLAAYAEKDYRFSFYRSSNGAEVDLIIETPQNECFGIEIKASDNPHTGKLRGLHSLKEDVLHAQLYCACLAPRKRMFGEIAIIPWQELFAEIELA